MRFSWRALVGTEIQPAKWVFVIGCYNSGTTLLEELIAAHPAISGLPREGVELTDGLRTPEDLCWPRMWLQCREYMKGFDRDPADLAGRIKRHWGHFVPSPGIVVEKSNSNLLRLPFLEAHFRPALFVYIRRNGYAVAEGIRRRARPSEWGRSDYPKGYPIEMCAAQWVAADAAFREGSASLSHVLEISYEELSEDPADVLGRLASFLGVEPFPAPLVDKTWSIHHRPSKIRNMNAEALARLNDDDRRSIEQVAGELLRQHGYLP